MGSKSIKILIADDHAVVRKGLRTLIESEPGMGIVAEAENGEEAVAKAIQFQPDVILLDYVMPKKNGYEAIVEIKEHFPDAKILILTSFAEDDKVFPAIKAGALGYLLKDSSPEQLLQAIKSVYEGESSLHPTIALKLIHELNQPIESQDIDNSLTSREVVILKLVAQGLTNQEIAERLVISERTVGNHISSILGKLHLANRTQAAIYALKEGLVNLEDK